MKLLTDMHAYEQWFLKEYLKVSHKSLSTSLFTYEELKSVVAESAPYTFPCLAFYDRHNPVFSGTNLRYVYKNELRLIQELLQDCDLSA